MQEEHAPIAPTENNSTNLSDTQNAMKAAETPEPPKRYGQDPTRVDLLLWPHPALKMKATPVDIISEEERAHVVATSKQMIDVAKAFKGVGLAANQVGSSRAFFVMQVGGGNWEVVVNPEITKRSADMKIWVEGCLSFPHKKERTRRPETIEVKYLALPDFAEVTGELTGAEAVCFQHEYDHLQGKTMRDRAFHGRVPPTIHRPSSRGPFGLVK